MFLPLLIIATAMVWHTAVISMSILFFVRKMDVHLGMDFGSSTVGIVGMCLDAAITASQCAMAPRTPALCSVWHQPELAGCAPINFEIVYLR